MDVLTKINNTYSAEDCEVLNAAYKYAEQMHGGQKRASGEPYFTHPCAVAEILVDLGLDAPTVAAAFLHDVVEDTPATEDDILRSLNECDREAVGKTMPARGLTLESVDYGINLF